MAPVVLCTVHEKKGYLPAFLGYTRQQEADLLDFSKSELAELVYFKNTARFFSENLKYLADPEFDPSSPPPSPGSPKKKRKNPPRKKAELARARMAAMSPPAAPASPFPSSRRSSRAPSPRAGTSVNPADYANFWEAGSDDEDE